MYFSIFIKIAYGWFIGFLLDVDSIRLLKVSVEGLFMFNSNDFGGCILIKHVIIVPFVQMHNLLNQGSSFEHQSINFKINVVD